jgi:hypothetical protein
LKKYDLLFYLQKKLIPERKFMLSLASLLLNVAFFSAVYFFYGDLVESLEGATTLAGLLITFAFFALNTDLNALSGQPHDDGHDHDHDHDD